MHLLPIGIAIVIGLTIYISFAAILRRFWISPPNDPNPQDITPVDLHFRCQVCGTQVTMTMAPNAIEEPDPPRHCREDMVITTSD